MSAQTLGSVSKRRNDGAPSSEEFEVNSQMIQAKNKPVRPPRLERAYDSHGMSKTNKSSQSMTPKPERVTLK